VRSKEFLCSLRGCVANYMNAAGRRPVRLALNRIVQLAFHTAEIRTPLHQVIGYIDLLEHQTNLSPLQAEYVQTLSASTSSLMTIINDLLDYTKLEAGKMKLETIPFSVRYVAVGSL